MSTKTPKTTVEIEAEIAALEALKPNVRHFTFFNDDNHAAIDAQIHVLRERLTSDGVHEAFGDPAEFMHGDDDEIDDDVPFDQHTLDSAVEAHDWMTGESTEQSPSESWKDVK